MMHLFTLCELDAIVWWAARRIRGSEGNRAGLMGCFHKINQSQRLQQNFAHKYSCTKLKYSCTKPTKVKGFEAGSAPIIESCVRFRVTLRISHQIWGSLWQPKVFSSKTHPSVKLFTDDHFLSQGDRSLDVEVSITRGMWSAQQPITAHLVG